MPTSDVGRDMLIATALTASSAATVLPVTVIVENDYLFETTKSCL